MQIDKKDYKPEEHDVYKALCVKQPWADMLTVVTYEDRDGYHADKEIELRSQRINYRGDLLICSSKNPDDLPGRLAGVTCGFVELYDVKPVEELTEEEWAKTGFGPESRGNFKGWYGWLMRNPRRVVEMPVKGQLGLFNLIVPKDDITEYPRAMAFGDDGWKIVKSKIK